MREYFVELSGYLITLTVALYTFECFLLFRLRQKKQRSACCIRQICLILISQFLCFFTLYCKSGNRNYLFFYLYVQLFLIMVMVLTPLLYRSVNRLLLHNMCMLLGLGFVILSRLSLARALRQFVIAPL